MKTIEVTKEVKNMLDAYKGDGESMNDVVARLISETVAPRKINRTKTNIRLHDATFNDLIGCKSYSTESHSDTILNLLRQIQ